MNVKSHIDNNFVSGYWKGWKCQMAKLIKKKEWEYIIERKTITNYYTQTTGSNLCCLIHHSHWPLSPKASQPVVCRLGIDLSGTSEPLHNRCTYTAPTKEIRYLSAKVVLLVIILFLLSTSKLFPKFKKFHQKPKMKN